MPRSRILVQVTIYRRLLIGRDGHLVREYGPRPLNSVVYCSTKPKCGICLLYKYAETAFLALYSCSHCLILFISTFTLPLTSVQIVLSDVSVTVINGFTCVNLHGNESIQDKTNAGRKMIQLSFNMTSYSVGLFSHWSRTICNKTCTNMYPTYIKNCSR